MIMKRKTLRQFIIFILLLAADITLFILLAKAFRYVLWDIVGYDIADYEDYYGMMESSRVYRFGSGCCEYLYVLLKALVLTNVEITLYKKLGGSKALLIISVIVHVIIFILCTVYVYRFLDGYNIFRLLRYFLTGAEPPF